MDDDEHPTYQVGKYRYLNVRKRSVYMTKIVETVKTHAEAVKDQAGKWKEFAGKTVDDYRRKQAGRRVRKLEEQLAREK